MKVLAAVALLLIAAGCGVDSASTDPAAAALSVRAEGCGPRTGIGSATLVADDLAITAAHVVAGADAVTVRDTAGVDHDAGVVAFDGDLDLALLAVPPGLGPMLPLSERRVEPRDDATTSVLRADGGVVALDVDIVRRANVATTDIHLDDDVTRPGFEVAADIEPGDSGAAIVVDGAITGIVWSRSLERDRRAWVVNVPDAMRAVIIGDGRDEVSTGRCVG